MEIEMDEKTAMEIVMGKDGNNGQKWRWMAMEMAMDKKTVMDDNGDGL